MTLSLLLRFFLYCGFPYIELRSLLSPEELRAAETAEREFEQERRDRELARRLQDQMQEGGGEQEDSRMAVEVQDREFAKVLQAKEEARVKRHRERARLKKLERQRERQEAVGVVGEEQGAGDKSLSPRSPDIQPPSRKPYMRDTAIDSHTNDTYCTKQITPEHSDQEVGARQEAGGSRSRRQEGRRPPSPCPSDCEPQYANVRRDGQPVAEEPCLHRPTSKEKDGCVGLTLVYFDCSMRNIRGFRLIVPKERL